MCSPKKACRVVRAEKKGDGQQRVSQGRHGDRRGGTSHEPQHEAIGTETKWAESCEPATRLDK